ncbi:MAG: FolC bifunctional protein [Verrucomicrobiales bacterium]|nr:FolC bifunctional protein [Verrucomicrobiales bacterium]
MTYPEAIQFLYDLRMFGAKFGLENTLKLAALAGSPQEKLRFIHVAGTNGKGSTCAMLESIYRTAGLKVGLFTSPHLVSFAERIQVNRQLIPESDVVRLVDEMKLLLQNFPAHEHPTFFEVVTVMALKYFAEHNCDLVIWETGLGGRLDSTNIVTPLVSVITNVQLDHQKWLGETLPEIAFEKAGIIKAGIPVITAAEEPDALRVIRETAREKDSPLTELATEKDSFVQAIALPLLGEHQKSNATLAVGTVRLLRAVIPISDELIRRGLETTYWPGRLHVFKKGAQTFILDGAHNLAGVECLSKTVQQLFPSKRPALILGVLSDKNWEAMSQQLAPLADKILLVPVQSERTTDPATMIEICRRGNPRAEIAACDSLADAIERAIQEPLVVITGSLYLIGEAMELLGISPAKSERGLNEWQAATSKEK